MEKDDSHYPQLKCRSIYKIAHPNNNFSLHQLRPYILGQTICKPPHSSNLHRVHSIQNVCSHKMQEFILPTNINTRATLMQKHLQIIHQSGVTPTSIYLNYIRTSSFITAGSRLIVRNDRRGCRQLMTLWVQGHHLMNGTTRCQPPGWRCPTRALIVL